jgi:hypothetical protein
MSEDFFDLIAELHHRIHRGDPSPGTDAERHAQRTMTDMQGVVRKLIQQRVSLNTLDLTLLYHWLHIATLNRFITDEEFSVLATRLDMVGQSLIATLKQIAAGIQDTGASPAMEELGQLLQQAKDAVQRLNPPVRLPHKEVVRQSELANREIWLMVSEWILKEFDTTIIESVLLYQWLRTSTIHANVPEEFFQKLERHWPEVMDMVGQLVDQFMRG